MARGQIVQLAIGDEFFMYPPKCALLSIVDMELPVDDRLVFNPGLVCQQRAKLFRRGKSLQYIAQQQRQFRLLVQFQAVLVDAPVHVDRQIGQAH